MKEFKYVITDQEGIHARPAGLLVKTCSAFSSVITISKGGRNADAKRIFGIMGLGVKQGEEIVLTAEGEDEDAAIRAVEEFLRENM